jgi:dienelactone hydrolase
MKPYLSRLRWLTAFVCLFVSIPAFTQFRQARLTWIGTPLNQAKTVDGFYESLPAGYSGGSEKYPLIIYLHGDESVEDGYTEILANGLPKRIADGGFPETFKVTGRSYSFIVAAPHYTQKNLTPDALGEAIDALIQRYRVDAGRIYLTGMSRGSAYTWAYAGASEANATRLAAIVPVSNALQPPQQGNADIIGDADLPVLATHNDEDYLVPASYTITYVDWVNERKPQPRAEIRLFESKEHEGWTRTYDPDFKYKGKNVYEWMLQHTRSAQAPLPVTLTAYKAFQSESGAVTITWTTASEINNQEFILERSGNGTDFEKLAAMPAAGQAETYTYTDNNPLPGANFYRLLQVDADGSRTYFPVLSVKVDRSNRPALVLYPNPVTNDALLELVHNGSGPVLFSVFNAGGMLVQQWTVQAPNSLWRQPVRFSKLSPGSYVLQARGGSFRYTVSFIKQ